MSLVDQRCFNHAMREAAVQCPSCKRFFCRECVTEHGGRMICVSCVNALARDADKTARTARIRWMFTALAGVLIAWLVFYYLGLTLARIPSKFHAGTVRLTAPDGRGSVAAVSSQRGLRSRSREVIRT